MEQKTKQRSISFEKRERRLLEKLCSRNPSPEEVEWYEEQLKMFESDDPERSSQAMDNMIVGFRKRNSRKLAV